MNKSNWDNHFSERESKKEPIGSINNWKSNAKQVGDILVMGNEFNYFF